MNLSALVKNVRTACRISANFKSALTYLRWIYAAKSKRSEHRIQFRLPNPIGDLDLNVRGNSGADAFIFSEVFLRSYYLPPTAARPSTILDLGGNIGLSSIFFARCLPAAQVAAVEPMPHNLALLQHNLALNAPKVSIYRAAIGTSDGYLSMSMNCLDYGHQVISDSETGGALTVKSASIPSILADLGWGRIGLLKIDIEGYEAVLLTQNNEWLRFVDAICIEVHGDFTLSHLEAALVPYGFAKPKELEGIIYVQRIGVNPKF